MTHNNNNSQLHTAEIDLANITFTHLTDRNRSSEIIHNITTLFIEGHQLGLETSYSAPRENMASEEGPSRRPDIPWPTPIASFFRPSPVEDDSPLSIAARLRNFTKTSSFFFFFSYFPLPSVPYNTRLLVGQLILVFRNLICFGHPF